MNKKLKIALLLIFALAGFVQAQQRPENVAIGDIFCSNGDILMPDAYTAAGRTDGIGVVFYVDGTGQHGWITYYKHSSSTLKWAANPPYHATGVNFYEKTRVPSDASKSLIKDLDGKGNTAEIVNEPDYSEANYPACYYATHVVDDGNWYLPAAGQLNFMYAYTPVLNASLEKISGYNPILNNTTSANGSNDSNYWSSDEYGTTVSGETKAWIIQHHGDFTYYLKSYNYPVRAVRDF